MKYKKKKETNILTKSCNIIIENRTIQCKNKLRKIATEIMKL